MLLLEVFLRYLNLNLISLQTRLGYLRSKGHLCETKVNSNDFYFPKC